MGVTAELCDKAVATTFDSLTPDAITKARRLVLDGIAVAIAGGRETAISTYTPITIATSAAHRMPPSSD